MDDCLDELSLDEDLIHNVSLIVNKYKRKLRIFFILLIFVTIAIAVPLFFIQWYLLFIPIPLALAGLLIFFFRNRENENHEYQELLLKRITKKCFGTDAIYQEGILENKKETDSEGHLNLSHLVKDGLFEGIYQFHTFESFHVKGEYSVNGEMTVIHEDPLEGNEIRVKKKTPFKGVTIISSLPLKSNSLHHVYVDNMAFSQNFSIYTDNKENEILFKDSFLSIFLALSRVFFGSRMFVLFKEDTMECIIEKKNEAPKINIYKPLNQNIYRLYDYYLAYINIILGSFTF